VAVTAGAALGAGLVASLGTALALTFLTGFLFTAFLFLAARVFLAAFLWALFTSLGLGLTMVFFGLSFRTTRGWAFP